jgi:hypothetical protein
VVRVCPNCKKSWSGGRDCPQCGPGFALLEAGDPRARDVLPPRSWAGIRALYGARRAMLIAIAGTLCAIGVAAIALRASVGAEMEVDRWAYRGLALVLLVGVVALALRRGGRIARRNRRGYDL